MGLTLDPCKLVTRSGMGGATWVVLEYWWDGANAMTRPTTAYCDLYKNPRLNKGDALKRLEAKITKIQTDAHEILACIEDELSEAKSHRPDHDLPDDAALRLTWAQLSAVARYNGLSAYGDVTDAKLYGVPVQIVTEPQDFFLSYGDR